MNPNGTKNDENQLALAMSTALDISWNMDAVGAPFNPNFPRLVSPLEPISGFPFFFPANSQGWSQSVTSNNMNTNTLHSVDNHFVVPSEHALGGRFVALGQICTQQTTEKELNSREAEWIQPPTSGTNYGKMKRSGNYRDLKHTALQSLQESFQWKGNYLVCFLIDFFA